MPDPELPPESRISSRVDGERLIITIPRARSREHWLIGSWGSAAVFSFLAITFIAQGLLTRNSSWTAGGLLFLLLTAFQIPLLLRFTGPIVFEITAGDLTEIAGPAESLRRRTWPRTSAPDLRSQPPISELSTLTSAEIDWLSDQINRKWGIVTDKSPTKSLL